ncbi:hypothetical protein [Blastococcus colisei]|nr:hypothetical protein [Blastococcus colisei]
MPVVDRPLGARRDTPADDGVMNGHGVRRIGAPEPLTGGCALPCCTGVAVR